jgi:hypothetical protein
MSFSYSERISKIQRALRLASSKGTIVFVPAEGTGNGRVGFPANLDGVIAAYSADAHGNPSRSNPSPERHEENFTFLGEDVIASQTNQSGQSMPPIPSSASFAMAVAAGIAALTLDILAREEELVDPRILQYLRSPAGMKRVFDFVSTWRDEFGFVTLWKLFRLPKRRDIVSIILEMVNSSS